MNLFCLCITNIVVWKDWRKNDQGNRFVKLFTVSTSSTGVQVSGSAKNLGCFPRDAWARGSTGGCRTWVVRRDHVQIVQQDHYKAEVASAAWWTCTVTTVNCRCFWMKFVIFQRYRSGVWWVKIYHENRSVNADGCLPKLQGWDTAIRGGVALCNPLSRLGRMRSTL